MSDCAFLTNHFHVLLCVARESDTRLRRIAECVGITERATHRIITELVDAGYLTRHRLGRQNFYEIHPEVQLRHPLEEDYQLGELLEPFVRKDRAQARRPGAAAKPARRTDSNHADPLDIPVGP